MRIRRLTDTVTVATIRWLLMPTERTALGMPANQPLPRFAEPPVIETVLGVEFAPLTKWDVVHFGLFWNEIQSDFPETRTQPALDSQIERFEKPKAAEPRVRLLLKPELRCWFVADDGRTLIQVQHNRFLFNWKKESAADHYPHFEDVIRPAFLREWSRFRRFVETKNLGTFEIVQAEVTYINHLEIGKGWSSAADLPQVFPSWSGKSSGPFLPPPEDVSVESRYLMPDNVGRLHISARPAIRNTDGTEVMQLSVTARGGPTGSDDDSIAEWLNKGREWVVRGFTDFTSDKMHKIWQRSQ